jgi:hypothetical protein
MELLPSVDDEELNDDYLETLGRNPNHDALALIRSETPLQAEIILHADNFMSFKGGRHTIREALARYPGLAIQDVRLPVSSLPPPPNGPPPNGGAKKRNKSKRRNKKKSNKKSRRHRNRKRLSRRNAKRFY